MRGYESTDRALVALESSGNTLVAAILCEHVDVYGYGLLSSDGGPATSCTPISSTRVWRLHAATARASSLAAAFTATPAHHGPLRRQRL